jgi:translation initiation factor 2B subunit (eIF-2B alpha/beta/delta family)
VLLLILLFFFLQIDNYAAVCQRALDYIHVDECILTYGYSRVVELFLKTVGLKRRFQVSSFDELIFVVLFKH